MDRNHRHSVGLDGLVDQPKLTTIESTKDEDVKQLFKEMLLYKGEIEKIILIAELKSGDHIIRGTPMFKRDKAHMIAIVNAWLASHWSFDDA